MCYFIIMSFSMIGILKEQPDFTQKLHISFQVFLFGLGARVHFDIKRGKNFQRILYVLKFMCA